MIKPKQTLVVGRIFQFLNLKKAQSFIEKALQPIAIAIFFVTGFASSSIAQNTWTPKTDLAGAGRGFAFSFAIGSKVYVGGGVDNMFVAKNDFWEYDIDANTWTQKANFEGGARYGAVSFTLNGRGYVGLGNDVYGSGLFNDMWEYDPIANDWSPITNFPGAARQGAAVFVTAGKAFIGMGQSANPNDPNDAMALNDLWLFDLGDPNVWSQKTSLPAEGRYYPASFSIGATGYVGGGNDDNDSGLADFWQYNPLGDVWTRKADLGGGARAIVPGVSLYGKGYVGSGGPGDFWQYDPITNSWSEKANITTGRLGATAVAVNGKIYLGTGLAGTPVKDFYAYTPDTDPVYAGTMYGSTGGGGNVNGDGVIYRTSATGTGLAPLYTFDLSAINGVHPQASLIEVNGKLYGTTPVGGWNASGVLYQLDLNGNAYSMILDFNSINSVGSQSGLTFAGGKLYGASRGGNGDPHGFIFQVDPATNTFTKKANFNGANGSDPYGGELLLVGDKLYGVTMAGGANSVGVIFEYNFRTNVITKRADFNGTNGSEPRSGLIEFSGMLYGVTPTGGASNKGVLYEFDMSSGQIAKRKDFAGNDGELPYSRLTVLNDKLYGVASDLGTGFTGVIFEYEPSTLTFTKKFDFDNTSAYTGSDPVAALTAVNGKLYGVTPLGGDNMKGALYSYDLTTGFTKIHNFVEANGAYPSSQLTFVRDNQTLTFNPLPTKMIDDAPFNLSATGSLNLPVKFYSSDEGVATISGNTVTITGAGTAVITAYIGRDNHFTYVNQNFVVNKKSQTITFNSLDAKTFGDNSFTVNATASSGLSVSYESDNTNVATVSGNTITIVGAGTATIKAKQSGNAEYAAAADVPRTLSVAKANQEITFGLLPEKTFGNAPFQLSATSTAGLTVTFASDATSVGSVSGTTLTVGNAGTATITASQAGNSNYNAAIPVQRTLTVARASNEITFNELMAKVVGDAAFTLTGTALFDAPTYSSSNPAVATVSGNTVTIIGAGQTDISASYAGSANVLPAVPVTRTLTVKNTQTITFNPLGVVSYTPTFQLTATASSGLGVQYTSETTSVATVSGSTVTILGTGMTKIIASQPGNGSFAAAPDVFQFLTVVKADQRIAFSAIPDKKLGDAAFTLTATASSGLPVSFSTTSNKVQLNGSLVTMIIPGQVSISAAQAGSALYNAAPGVQQSFCLAPAKPTISINGENTETPVLTSSALTGNQWYANGTVIVGATNQTLTVTEPGTYNVQATAEGCISDFSDNFPVIVTAIEASSSERISIYPNPVADKLTIAIPHNTGSKIRIVKADGSVVQTFETASPTVEVDVRNNAAGFYVLHIQTNQSQFIGKFIKK